MADGSTVGWETCAEAACAGVQLPSGDRCWAHADTHDLDVALDQIREGDDLDGRGVTFTADLLERVLDAIPNDDERARVNSAQFIGATFEGQTDFGVAKFVGDATFVGARFVSNADFEDATFEGFTDFEGATFDADATFHGTTFAGDAFFNGATFAGDTTFNGATFAGEANLEEATFAGEAHFDSASFAGESRFQATFEGDATFEQATFKDHAVFVSATFDGDVSFEYAAFDGTAAFGTARFNRDASFSLATFNSDAAFGAARFKGDASFPSVTFNGNAYFSDTIFKLNANFGQTTFEQARELGPMLVGDGLILDGARFRERILIEVSAASLSCQRARFLAGVQMRVHRAQVALDDADLAAPSVLSGATGFPGWDEGGPPESAPPVDAYGTPRLVSLRGADVAGLTVAGVDLRACRFVDAHHLDRLRAEASTFPSTPPGWQWTKRRTIAEEQQWRASEDGQEWYGPENQPPGWLEIKELVPGDAGLLLPGRIAPLYRDLRKGLEDKKDEPGAADFYYGEMEMRRHDKRQELHLERTLRFRNGGFGISAAAEWVILTLYWLVSGYGLRAWRAIASLAAVALVASVILAFWGFAAPEQPAFRPVGVDAQGDLIYERQEGDRPAGWDELPTALRFSAQATTALLRGPDVRALTTVGDWLQIALRLIGPVLLGLAILSVRGRVKR